jgi:hypothetical protein
LVRSDSHDGSSGRLSGKRRNIVMVLGDGVDTNFN